MANALNWFEIPVQDLARAARFYEEVLGEKLRQETFTGIPMAIFVRTNPHTLSGALIKDARRQPSADGSLLYLNATGKLDACLERVSRAGGKVLMPKTAIGDPGFIALIQDTEGNTLGLHAPRG